MSTASSLAPASPARPEGRRHLRVGILQGKRIVEERVFRAAESITLGPGAADTFIVPPDTVARAWRLFEERRGRLVLRLSPRMTARLAAAGEVTMFDAAADEPLRTIVLPEGARGKVTVGDTTILFQRIRPPAPQPRPRLPASVRRHVFAELDLPFVGIAALTLLLHVLLIVYLRQVDWPRKPAIDELPDRFLHEYARRPRPAPAPTLAARPEPKPAAPSHARPAARPSGPVVARPAKPVESEAERRARLDKEVQKLGVVALLTAKGEGATATKNLLERGAAPEAVEDALRNVGGVTVATDDSLRLRVGTGTGKIGTPAGLRGAPGIADPTKIGPAVERGVKTDVREGPPSVEDGHVDPAAIAREIRGRRKAIAACYERALKQQPTLAGKLVLRFSLAAAGTVTAVEIDDDTLGAPDVASCIRAVVLRWRFPALAEGAAELSFPFVFQPGG